MVGRMVARKDSLAESHVFDGEKVLDSMSEAVALAFIPPFVIS